MQTIHLNFKLEVFQKKIHTIHIQQRISEHPFKQNEIFASLTKMITGCLSNYYTSSQIIAKDEIGEFSFILEEKEDTRSYLFPRDTRGDLILEYNADIFDLFNWPNPALSLHYRNSGITGYASTFLLIPEDTYLYEIQYDHLKDTYCACSQGLEDIHKVLTNQEIQETCFAFEVPYMYHKEGSQFYILYFENDFKFFDEIKEKLTMYFDYMKEIFLGRDEPYFIFMYRKEKKFNISLTGTAEKNVCLMGYGDELISSYKQIESTLVHELVHNFILLKDQETAFQSIFDEGTADYYATMIPYYLNINSKEDTISSINAMIKQYYSNPWKEKELVYSYERSWSHAYACRMMYGKGIILITGLEALLKQYQSKATLIDYIQRLIKEQSQHEAGLIELLKWIDEEVEGKATEYFLQLCNGGKVVILPELFEDYQVVESTVSIEENGFDDQVAYLIPKKVFHIKEDSNAYKAGLRNGDIILNKLDEWRHGEDETRIAHLQIEREGKTFMISYLPRGQKTYLYQYEK